MGESGGIELARLRAFAEALDNDEPDEVALQRSPRPVWWTGVADRFKRRTVLPSSTDRRGLSYVGEAVSKSLSMSRYRLQRGQVWNISSGTIVGPVCQTPPGRYWGEADTPSGHSDELPQQIYDLVVRARHFVDITSLGPPDGLFEEKLRDAITHLAKTGRKVTFRLLFGHIIGMPVHCNTTLQRLVQGVPPGSKVQVWVGAYRKGISWNHSKIIAVDGRYLMQGGHNLWGDHYLKGNPVHDLSMQVEGPVTVDAHRFADKLWKYVIDKVAQRRTMRWKRCINKFLSRCVSRVVVNVARFPRTAPEMPPRCMDHRQLALLPGNILCSERSVPIISVGRCGQLARSVFGLINPSDTAIETMLRSAKKSIQMSLQDLGPLTLMLPTPIAIPGGVWPTAYLLELCRAVAREVSVHIVLSNPYACPSPCGVLDANYGNGWTSTDVASEIVKMLVRDSKLDSTQIRELVHRNLQVTTIHRKSGMDNHPDGGHVGNHAKFFIVDELCYYLGSQNLYIADLAEWGLIVDSEAQTREVIREYWEPLWAQSEYAKVTVDQMMKGKEVRRTPPASRVQDANDEVKERAASARTSTFSARTAASSVRSLVPDELAEACGLERSWAAESWPSSDRSDVRTYLTRRSLLLCE